MHKTLYVTVALILSLTIGLYIYKNGIPNTEPSTIVISSNGQDESLGIENPLINASRAQLDRWLPSYCGPDLYLDRPVKPHARDVCIRGTIERVQTSTGISITKEDVLDPRVKANWKTKMGVR